jgi:hypothetical protein
MKSGLSAVGPQDAGSGGTVKSAEPARSDARLGQTCAALPGT